jgi:hypothetical protein
MPLIETIAPGVRGHLTIDFVQICMLKTKNAGANFFQNNQPADSLVSGRSTIDSGRDQARRAGSE